MTEIIKELATWRAVVDILLITAGLFFLYRTLLRLGTWAIFTGILLATAVFFTANFLDLKGIEWIYSNLSHVALIALIVIFQPETTTPIYLETIRETTTLFCKIIAPPAIQPMDRRWPDVEVNVEVKPKK